MSCFRILEVVFPKECWCFCLSFGRIPLGFFSVSAWLLILLPHGFLVVSTWFGAGFHMVCGFLMVSTWLSVGFLMVPLWFPAGLRLASSWLP